jgi:serine/threonine protein kinase
MNDTLPASPADRSPKSRVNTVFAGEFKLIRHLGRGDVADTYLAELLDPPALVALKIVRAELAGDRGQVEWLLREARAAAAVIDDHVAQVLDADISPEGEVYIVGEYVEGEDLGVLLRRTGRLPWARVRKLALQLVAGLRAAHEAGVLHRVIKPSNVLLQAEDRVKIVDFGLVRLENVTADREPGTVVLGDAVHFIAPEQALGEQVDARSDIYSLGVLLYTLLTGRVPFFGRPTQVAMQHKFATAAAPGSVAPEAGIPAVVEALILRAMSKRRESRFADMATLEQALREIGDDGQRRGGRGGVSTETVRAQPTTDSAMFYSLESLQTMLAATQDPRAQLGIYEKMGRALVTLSGGQNSAEAEAWRGWIAQGREYAYYQLAERHLAAEQWSELVEVYREHADATTDRNQKIGLLNAMGYVYDHSLADPRQAIAAYREMIALEPNAPDAVLALARLLERTSAWEEAAAALDHFLSLCNDPVQRGEELTRAGQLLHQRLHASERAEAYLHSALELQPGHAPALVLLADIYRGRKDYPRLAATLEALAVGGRQLLRAHRVRRRGGAALLPADRRARQGHRGVRAGDGARPGERARRHRALEDLLRVRQLQRGRADLRDAGAQGRRRADHRAGPRRAVPAGRPRRAAAGPGAARAQAVSPGPRARARQLGRAARPGRPAVRGRGLRRGLRRLPEPADARRQGEDRQGRLEHQLPASPRSSAARTRPPRAAPFLRRALEQDPSNWPALQATLEAQMAEGDYQGALNTRKGDDQPRAERRREVSTSSSRAGGCFASGSATRARP